MSYRPNTGDKHTELNSAQNICEGKETILKGKLSTYQFITSRTGTVKNKTKIIYIHLCADFGILITNDCCGLLFMIVPYKTKTIFVHFSLQGDIPTSMYKMPHRNIRYQCM